MKIINQPHDSSIGVKLKEILEDSQRFGYETFYFIVAYVNEGGVSLLKPSLDKFRTSGGHIKAVVGIDQGNTTAQGLKLLMPLCDELYVYHSASPVQTFHPKVYVFEKSGEKAIVFIGSNNLTTGGLFTNYEVSSYTEYDLKDKKDAETYSEFKTLFERYSKPSECSKILSEELLKKLVDNRYLPDEHRTRLMAHIRSGMVQREKMFGAETFRVPKGIKIPRQVRLEEFGKVAGVFPSPELKGNLLWKKKLTPSDILYTEREGTNPTGGVRLTQADWKFNGQKINQTTFFRENLFKDFTWRQVKAKPYVEVAEVLFDVKILGGNTGQHLLKIRHKPSGEARQGNYTTSVSWGELGSLIRKANLTGKEFLLYAPPKGQKEPFFIEIK